MKSFSISNKNLSLTVLDYGATIQSLKFNGKEMVLGFENFNDYLKDNNYLGAIVGRYANRISNGEITVNGKKYALTKNEPNKTLHGGEKGLSKVYWQGKVENNKIVMEYFSANGEEGFPGDLT
jgi:aldose 1-epimerase